MSKKSDARLDAVEQKVARLEEQKLVERRAEAAEAKILQWQADRRLERAAIELEKDNACLDVLIRQLHDLDLAVFDNVAAYKAAVFPDTPIARQTLRKEGIHLFNKLQKVRNEVKALEAARPELPRLSYIWSLDDRISTNLLVEVFEIHPVTKGN